MRPFRRAEPFEGDDWFSLHTGDRGLAGPGGGAVNHDGAGATLAEAAAELCGGQAQLTQYIEKWFAGIRRVDGLRIAVDAQVVSRHVTAPFAPRDAFPRHPPLWLSETGLPRRGQGGGPFSQKVARSLSSMQPRRARLTRGTRANRICRPIAPVVSWR